MSADKASERSRDLSEAAPCASIAHAAEDKLAAGAGGVAGGCGAEVVDSCPGVADAGGGVADA
ncbi:MAG: hypothetical protein LAN36_09825 [Acidobacteriia bacterium]|nr:hypothetical protein [Terriglobia bacterium]